MNVREVHEERIDSLARQTGIAPPPERGLILAEVERERLRG